MSDESGIIRLVIFLSALVIFALWEAIVPRRERHVSRKIRWSRNLGIVAFANLFVGVVNTIATRILAPITAAAAAIWATNNGIGLFNWLAIPQWIAVISSVILLDALIYGQHVLFHWHPALWRLHKVHHVDQELDVTSGIRFHPIEILLSVFIKSAAVILLGVPFIAVVIFEVVLNVSAMFNHGNIKLPLGVDRIVRLFIVTPDMHRVHHSVIPRETHSNFGFNLSIWDRIFRTYRDQPEAGHDAMTLGLPEYQSVPQTGLMRMLVLPFEKPVAKASQEDDAKGKIDPKI